MSVVKSILQSLPMFVAPFILVIFSMVSAYVFRFGLPRTGIHFDYILFVIVVVVALAIGGAI